MLSFNSPPELLTEYFETAEKDKSSIDVRKNTITLNFDFINPPFQFLITIGAV
jgi:hypothetical protein